MSYVATAAVKVGGTWTKAVLDIPSVNTDTNRERVQFARILRNFSDSVSQSQAANKEKDFMELKHQSDQFEPKTGKDPIEVKEYTTAKGAKRAKAVIKIPTTAKNLIAFFKWISNTVEFLNRKTGQILVQIGWPGKRDVNSTIETKRTQAINLHKEEESPPSTDRSELFIKDSDSARGRTSTSRAVKKRISGELRKQRRYFFLHPNIDFPTENKEVKTNKPYIFLKDEIAAHCKKEIGFPGETDEAFNERLSKILKFEADNDVVTCLRGGVLEILEEKKRNKEHAKIDGAVIAFAAGTGINVAIAKAVNADDNYEVINCEAGREKGSHKIGVYKPSTLDRCFLGETPKAFEHFFGKGKESDPMVANIFKKALLNLKDPSTTAKVRYETLRFFTGKDVSNDEEFDAEMQKLLEQSRFLNIDAEHLQEINFEKLISKNKKTDDDTNDSKRLAVHKGDPLVIRFLEYLAERYANKIVQCAKHRLGDEAASAKYLIINGSLITKLLSLSIFKNKFEGIIKRQINPNIMFWQISEDALDGTVPILNLRLKEANLELD